ncbi:MAG: 1-deoxy-D-xylulose-5-phosphate synthase [Bifidobacteriaceae bacterium]|jgi:1-deoxy-D-xylulose-5-phosphate synthase|nr:1-deoxy-D-xylulose-5-phosphate synthase [Bifidobacteriaceae bacterium]
MLSLDSYNFPDDIKKMSLARLEKLSKEIRQFLIENIAETGGHLGPNLGVVELTLGIFKVYNPDEDFFIYDVGHQTYVHKILTGRTNFSALRQAGGLSGYPNRSESSADILENSHASVSLSWADGISRANILQKNNSTTVALVGDGALAGGMIWEAINHIAHSMDQKLIIIINDNGMAYGETVGGLAHHLSAMTGSKTYYDIEHQAKETLKKLGNFGKIVYKIIHNFKIGVKVSVLPKRIFSDFDIRYIGPINGHSLIDVIHAFEQANRYKEPVIIHAITQKGQGFLAAKHGNKDNFHTIGKFNPKTGQPIAKHSPCWSHIMGKYLEKLASKNDKIVAISAAMLEPVGLEYMQKKIPDRVYDVGIAEPHAVGFAAGLAYKGLHPVLAVYSTFANRIYDQLLFDVSLHKAPITLCLDRAGATGDDGPSHNGIWDISLFSSIPNIRMSAPWDKQSLQMILQEAVKIDNCITLIRYPKGDILPDLPTRQLSNKFNKKFASKTFFETESAQEGLENNILCFHASEKKDNLIIVLGPLIHSALKCLQNNKKYSQNTTIISCRWFFPIDEELVKISFGYKNIIIAEDGILQGGFGESFLAKLNKYKNSFKALEKANFKLNALKTKTSERKLTIPKINLLGIEKGFQSADSRDNILRNNNLDACGFAKFLI